MNNPHRTLAEIHKFSINPANQRTLDELESYYHNLAHGSPLARAFSEIAAEDRANEAQEFAELTTRAAMNRASAKADDTAEAVRYAEEQAEIWTHLAYADKREQIDAHLESNFPELGDDAREAIVDRVCRG